jgi:hypothetical protein
LNGVEKPGYFLGSGICSTIHAQPLWGMGFLSAFLTIWIFMFVSFDGWLVNLNFSSACSAQVLDDDVDEPGAQRALLLARVFHVVFHDRSLSCHRVNRTVS